MKIQTKVSSQMDLEMTQKMTNKLLGEPEVEAPVVSDSTFGVIDSAGNE